MAFSFLRVINMHYYEEIKEVNDMILTTILVIILLTLAILLGTIVLGLGAGFIVLFGDLIVFVLIVRFIIRICKRIKSRKG